VITDPAECGEIDYRVPEPDLGWRPCPETITSSTGALRCVHGDEIDACVTFEQCQAWLDFDGQGGVCRRT
jgi:hypothetical protein